MAYDDYGKWHRVRLTRADLKVLHRHRNLFDLVSDLIDTNDTLRLELFQVQEKHEQQVAQLKQRIRNLERSFLKDSHNSHLPPSSEGLRKPKRILRTRSLRKKSNRRPGGQPGHPGYMRPHVRAPDQTVTHGLLTCKGCGGNLSHKPLLGEELRQVVDLRQGSKYVTEHRAQRKRCPVCHRRNRAKFPKSVSAYLSYGVHVQSLVLYFSVYQLIPVARIQEIFHDLYEIEISQATICNMIVRASMGLKHWENETKRELIRSKIVHFDETGMRCQGKNSWLQVSSNPALTLLALCDSRGREAWEVIGVLPEFRGWAIHDGFRAYFKYRMCHHGLCNAHHLRELAFIHEEEHEGWAKKMKTLLEGANNYLTTTQENGKTPASSRLRTIEKEYYRILSEGYRLHREPMSKTWHKQKSKERQEPGKRLLDRLRDYHRQVLAFLLQWDQGIPFTNNQAERDLRMAKVKQKISGGFRSYRGAKSLCRVRSFLSSLKKQGISPLKALELCC